MKEQRRIFISNLLHCLIIMNSVLVFFFMIGTVGYIVYCSFSKKDVPVQIFILLFYMFIIVQIPSVFKMGVEVLGIKCRRQIFWLHYWTLILYGIFSMILVCLI